ncbi:MAG: MBL fold metallo-hydrolase [Candidatus Magasanikbacteria bacterium]|nr:MBL fold metallo-hydrolase [Candidatus Magasanikbacteria bacterium]
MHLSWLGNTCVKLQTKHLDEDVLILIDAYKPLKGEFPRSFTPTAALFSIGMDNAATLSGTPLLIDTLGEFETKNVMILAIPGNDQNLIFKIMIEGISVVHLGHITKKLTAEAVEKLGHVDILLAPAGQPEFTFEDSAALITELEPRVVIPISYQCDTDPKAEPLSKFLKEVGLKPAATDKKFILKKKDLPQEDTALYVLEKSV